eukprot:12530505-Prorocentrum_lima.AAC.1
MELCAGDAPSVAAGTLWTHRFRRQRATWAASTPGDPPKSRCHWLLVAGMCSSWLTSTCRARS